MCRATLLALLLFSVSANAIEESICFGSQSNGNLENGWQLPTVGENYSAYSYVGVLAGRNYVHSKIYKVVLDAYAELKIQTPLKVYVYGESGNKNGGKFWPHKTHQNGLSVDFFVPVVNKEGASVKLPISVLNKLGYGIEFVGTGEYGDLKIDYKAMANHLLALKIAADNNSVKIWRVIFDNELQKQLFKVSEAKGLRDVMTFSTKKPWVRHDEHYHVDFLVPCQPFR